MAKRLRIAGTSYLPIFVWDGPYHEIGVRVLDEDDPEGTRWRLQGALQNAGGFGAIRRLTNEAARNQRRHRTPIRRRSLARRLLVEIEPLVRDRLVLVIFDGKAVRTEE